MESITQLQRRCSTGRDEKQPAGSSSFLAREKVFDERLPLVVERGTRVVAARTLVPILGVGCGAFFAMEVGVDGHSVFGLELVDERVGFLPSALGVVPESGERDGEVSGGSVEGERGAELLGSHNWKSIRRGEEGQQILRRTYVRLKEQERARESKRARPADAKGETLMQKYTSLCIFS